VVNHTDTRRQISVVSEPEIHIKNCDEMCVCVCVCVCIYIYIYIYMWSGGIVSSMQFHLTTDRIKRYALSDNRTGI
jgi:hypothetical protein